MVLWIIFCTIGKFIFGLLKFFKKVHYFSPNPASRQNPDSASGPMMKWQTVAAYQLMLRLPCCCQQLGAERWRRFWHIARRCCQSCPSGFPRQPLSLLPLQPLPE
ncbi:hypothetical protein [Erwinia sp. B116]|uniref:hypothetical protein n=1 Tax=Erwinia sp. B116 TaxID=1561024 RepID=UPI0018EB1390|nr:hypothetical protein [Erwinia sp. B116]